MGKNIKKVFNSDFLPFLILAIGLIPIHLVLTLGTGDDPTYVNVLSDPNLLGYFIARYNVWSSRLLIEFIMISIVNHGNIWIVCDILIMVLTAITISKLFVRSNIRNTNWIITFLMFIYPYTHMSSAGWMATTLSYTWILAFGLFSMIPIKKMIYDDKISWYEYIFYIPVIIIATNHELMCLILFSIYLVFSIYLLMEKKAHKYLLIPLAACCASLVFILTCPGNVNRNISEIARWFPGFKDISFFRKIEMGFSTAIFEFVMKPNMVFTIFSGLLLLLMILKSQKKSYRVIAAIPFISSLTLGLFGNITTIIFPGILKIINSMTEIGTGVTFSSIRSWVPDFILIIVCFSILVSIYLLFDNKRDSLFLIFIILLGFGSRFIMGFSPTIWASSTRTYIFMYFSFIICSVIIYNIILKNKNFKYNNACFIIIGTIGFLSFVNTLMEVL